MLFQKASTYPSLTEFLPPLQPPTLVNFYQSVDWLFLGFVICGRAFMDRRILNIAQKQTYAVLRAGEEVSWIDTLHISLKLKRFPLHRTSRIPLQLFSHSVRRNVAVMNFTDD